MHASSADLPPFTQSRTGTSAPGRCCVHLTSQQRHTDCRWTSPALVRKAHPNAPSLLPLPRSLAAARLSAHPSSRSVHLRTLRRRTASWPRPMAKGRAWNQNQQRHRGRWRPMAKGRAWNQKQRWVWRPRGRIALRLFDGAFRRLSRLGTGPWRSEKARVQIQSSLPRCARCAEHRSPTSQYPERLCVPRR